MGFQIFRFEVLGEASRNGANVVYDARDSAYARSVQLYEWTPLPDNASSAAETLLGMAAELDGFETFSSGPRLYLAAAKAEAGKALRLLRSHGLFSGEWPGLFEESGLGSVVTDTNARQPLAGGGGGVVWPTLFAFACLALGVVVLWAISLSQQSDQLKSDRDKARMEGQSTVGRIEELGRELEIAKVEFNRQKEFLAKHQSTEADMAYAAFHLAEENVKPPSGFYALTLENQCLRAGRIFAAVRYMDLQGAWVVRGWWGIAYGQNLETDVYSKDGAVYVYAENNGSMLVWNGMNEADAVQEDVVQQGFIRPASQTLTDASKRTVSMSRVQGGVGSLHLKRTFVCRD